jgi:hypothetical protein
MVVVDRCEKVLKEYKKERINKALNESKFSLAHVPAEISHVSASFRERAVSAKS